MLVLGMDKLSGQIILSLFFSFLKRKQIIFLYDRMIDPFLEGTWWSQNKRIVEMASLVKRAVTNQVKQVPLRIATFCTV